MHDASIRRRALALVAQGHSLSSAARQCGVSHASVRSWRDRPEPAGPPRDCPRCATPPRLPGEPAAYAHLLGLYLGDGCISAHPRTHVLRVACDAKWPGLIEECADAMRAVRPLNRVSRVRQAGCVTVLSYSRHWPCLFPQHAPGRKHDRHIALEGWQQGLVDAFPRQFVRGLTHSDGCRITNRTVRTVAGERRSYSYPRYFFTNRSADIVDLYCAALDRIGVEWRLSRRPGGRQLNVSVARRGSVELMDAHVGPKY